MVVDASCMGVQGTKKAVEDMKVKVIALCIMSYLMGFYQPGGVVFAGLLGALQGIFIVLAFPREDKKFSQGGAVPKENAGSVWTVIK